MPERCSRALSAAALAVALAAAGPRPAPAAPPAVARPSETCLECHAGIERGSHPLGVRPPAPPPGLPLAADGTVACGTCHTEEFHGVGDARRPRLRGGGSLCGRCHEAWGHRSLAELAHAGAGGSGAPPTRACLGCHDGTVAPPAHVRGPGATEREAPRVRLDRMHPVGVAYGAAAAARPRGYRPAAALPRAIRLEEGRVGCTSCHDLYAPPPGRLAIPNRGSALCLACHAKASAPRS